jgi:lysyl-tRNA synthetase class 2
VPSAEIVLKLSGGFLNAEAQRAGLILLASMLLSFGFIRFSTRMIRAEVSWWPGNVETGGIHIHHLVFGIVLLMLTGFLGLAVQPDSPWTEILSAGFGIGMGLTLDEYALWLHLEDVYWAEEGRRSVDAVIFAALIGGLVLFGTVPLGANGSGVVLLVTVAVNLAFCVLAALKGKYTSAVAGMLLPPVAWVAAIRLARPDSFWARRRYPPEGGRMARSRSKEARRHRRRTRFQDAVGGWTSDHGLPGPGKSDPEEPPAS